MKLNITLPVYNEQAVLVKNTLKLHDFLYQKFNDHEWQIIIVDNASKDETKFLAQELTEKYPRIKYLFINEKGKGIAVKKAWQKFTADIYAFMDIDLAADLEYLPELVQAVQASECDLAIGSRAMPGAEVERSFLRKLISRTLNSLLAVAFGSKIKDHPCGFKAVNEKVVRELLPLVYNDTWFFDTELLIWAQKKNFKIKEMPIKWQAIPTAGRKSKVGIITVVINYLREIWRLRKRIKT